MIGSRLRQYVVAGKLGEGGMGVVWRARDTMLDRDVALKVLPADGAHDEVRRERFFREARAASALNHPNIVTVYEINSEAGVDFIAMELVEGETLSKRLAAGPLPVPDALDIARQVAEAVARAHRAGIVHRDLKPGNVMINADGLVKVLDFGIAKVTDARKAGEKTSEETRLALTRAGTALGTRGYMSPEQAVGDPADARSDVFSFGVMLYEMLAGALPFQGHTNTELLRALHFAEPEPLEHVRPDVASWVSSIVTKALAKDPRDRFESMGEVAAALRGSVVVPSAPRPSITPAPAPASAPVATPEPVARERSGRRTPPAWSVVAIVSTVAFSAWALVPWGTLVDRGREPASATPSARLETPFDLSTQAAEALTRRDRGENLDRAIDLLQRALAIDKGYAPAYAHLAEAYRLKHRESPDQQWLTLAREAASAAVAQNPDLALAHAAAGFVELETGARDAAFTSFRRAETLDPLNDRAALGLALATAAAGDGAAAEVAFSKAVKLGPDDWRIHNELGLFHYRRDQLAQAAAAWETARRLTPDNVLVLRNLGAVYYRLDRADEAASALQAALEIRPTAPTYANLGTIRFAQGQFADAASAFEKARDLGANSYLAWGNLGDAYRWAPGRRPEAAAAYQRARQLLDEQLDRTPNAPDLLTSRALYLAKMGDIAGADADLGRIPSGETLTAQMLMRIAVVRERSRDRGAALDAIARAIAAGHPVRELAADPELLALRSDPRYHAMVAKITDASRN